MKLSLRFSLQLIELIQGNSLPFSDFNKKEINLFLSEQVLQLRIFGRSKMKVLITDKDQLTNYLKHKYGINNLDKYITTLQKENETVAGAAVNAGYSKIKPIRNITGFLANSIKPIKALIDAKNVNFPLPTGTQCFVSDYKLFRVPSNVIIVGVENAANFIYLKEQIQFFSDADYLFVSRYPQSGDLIKWLNSINNKYLHFGDFDLAGMDIYLHEIKKHLGERASYFLPNNLPELFNKYANDILFHRQYHKYRNNNFRDYPELKPLADIIYKTGKCVEHQVLIMQDEKSETGKVK